MSGVQESPQEHIVIQNYSKNSNAMRQGPSSTASPPFPIPTGFCPAWRQSLANAACHGVPLVAPTKKNQLSHIGVSPDPLALRQCPMEPQILPAPTLQRSREERSTPRSTNPQRHRAQDRCRPWAAVRDEHRAQHTSVLQYGIRFRPSFIFHSYDIVQN